MRFGVWLLAAGLGHAAIALVVARGASAAPPTPLPPIEIEIAPPPPPTPTATATPTPEPTIAPTATAPKDTTVAIPHAPIAPAKGPSVAAKAGALLTAKADAPLHGTEAPVSFVSDENGGTFGSGVVAKGGTASAGGATPAPAIASSTPAPPIAKPSASPIETPVTNLSRKPTLDRADPCKGWFPSSATDDHATVTLRLLVRPSGDVASASVLSESPTSQGFGAAARSCLLATKLVPALDVDGKPALAHASVIVRFSR